MAGRVGAVVLACLSAIPLAPLPLAPPLAAQEGGAGWSGALGIGLALDLDQGAQPVSTVGIASQAQVTLHRRDGTGWGLRWDGAWMDGRFATEKRFLLSAVMERRLGASPIRLRVGPGVGLATVVEVDFPPAGTVGDGLVSIGDSGSWGGVVGLSGRLGLGAVSLAPAATLVYQRAGGHAGGTQDFLTLSMGGRVRFGP